MREWSEKFLIAFVLPVGVVSLIGVLIREVGNLFDGGSVAHEGPLDVDGGEEASSR